MNMDEELVGDFLVEADELVNSLDEDFVELEHRKDDLELLNKIFRAAHTIKGSSSFLGFKKVQDVTHEAEDILNKLRHAEMTLSAEMMDVLLEFVDILKLLLDEVRNGTNSLDTTEFVAKLQEAKEGRFPGVDPSAPKPEKAAAPAPVAGGGAPAAKSESSGGAKGGDKKAQKQDANIRVEVARLDNLMDLTGELVLSRNRLQQITAELENRYESDYLVDQLIETTSAVGLITTELQMAVMKTRMVQVGTVFKKFPRIVRDISRDTNKQIDLIIEGEETELDKSVIEEIGDPLMHMIRNACDHGVETPDVRAQFDKPETGTVRLSAYYEGNHIVIEISDDGAGLDPEKLKKKAVEKKVISPEEASTMTINDAYNIIFKPGFSTAATITNISGRGVGMDVVKTNIEALNGIIHIESDIGHGTTFKIKLPLTLAIIQSLLVEVSSEIFAIPLVSVIETVRITAADIHNYEGREVMKLRDTVLSLIRLDSIYNLEETDSENLFVVIVGLAEKQLGLVVNKLLGQVEIVVKSLGEYLGLGAISGIAGATIMGDGRVRLILDVAGIMELASKQPLYQQRNRKKAKPEGKASNNNNNVKVAVVDDSSTDRKIMTKLLESSGWITVQAFDSSQKFAEKFESIDVDLVVSDLMMPNMTGIEMSEHLRLHGFTKPIILCSSRSEVSEQKRINSAGIDAFILKPVDSAVLLRKVDELYSKSKGAAATAAAQ